MFTVMNALTHGKYLQIYGVGQVSEMIGDQLL